MELEEIADDFIPRLMWRRLPGSNVWDLWISRRSVNSADSGRKTKVSMSSWQLLEDGVTKKMAREIGSALNTKHRCWTPMYCPSSSKKISR